MEGLLTADQFDSYAPSHDPKVEIYGGREEACKILKRISEKEFINYETERNDPHAQKTTRIAAYLKFGTLSFKEVFHASVAAYTKQSTFVSELYWREFYYQLTFHKPALLCHQISSSPNEALKLRMNTVRWRSSSDVPEHWDAWIQGRTGFPIVDAAMRQLSATGYMHNRPRMVF